MDFLGSRLVFHDSRLVLMGLHGSRSVFHDSRLFLWFVMVSVQFLMIPGFFIVCHGSKLVYIQAERRRREVRR